MEPQCLQDTDDDIKETSKCVCHYKTYQNATTYTL